MSLVDGPSAVPAATRPGWSRRVADAVAVLSERRLPYRLSVALDRLCLAIGLRTKTISAGGYRVRVRRLTTDEHFVKNILIGREYLGDGYEIGEADTVIDIGGNIGSFALLASKYAARGVVYTFEPVLENFRLLTRNLAANAAGNVVARRAAVLGTRGVARFYLNPTNTGAHSVFEHYGAGSGEVESAEAITLEDHFREHRIERCGLLKLDCEGSEYQILHGLPPEVLARIDRIVMEYHSTTPSAAETREQADRLVEHLCRAGYVIDTYSDTGGCGIIRARRPEASAPDRPGTLAARS